MANTSGSIIEEFESESQSTYKQLAPSAILTLVLGIISLIAASAVIDLNIGLFLIAPISGALIGFRALDSIKRYEMAGKGIAITGLSASILGLVGGLSFAGIHYATEVPEGYTRISYRDLQPEGVELYPESAEALNEQKIFMKGYMYPTSEMEGITKFILCRDNGTCCFGGQPKMADMVEVTLPEELAIDFRTSLVTVGGTFRVDPTVAPSERGIIVYYLDADLAR